MNDVNRELHANTRHAVDDLAQAWGAYRRTHPGEDADAWFDQLRRMIQARAATLGLVEALGPMGGGGSDEA